MVALPCVKDVIAMKHNRLAWPGILATVLGCLWLGLFPLWQDFSYAHITRAKWTGALLLSSAGLMAAGVACLLLLRRKEWRQVAALHPAQLLAAAYFAWVALSAWQGRLAGTVNAQGQSAVLWGAIRYEGLMTQLCYAAIFLTMSLFRPQHTPLAMAAAAAVCLFCTITALQYAGLNPLGLFPPGRSIRTNYEFQGTIGNIDMVSGYLCLMVPLLLGSYILGRRSEWYLLAAGALGILLECCMGVQSGLIAMGVLALLILLLMLRSPAHRSRGMLVLAMMVLCLGLRKLLHFPWLEGTEQVCLGFSAAGAALLLLSALLIAAAAMLRRHPGRAISLRAIVCVTLLLAVLSVAAVALLPVPPSAAGLWELHETLLGRGQDSYGSWRWGAWRHTLLMSRESLFFGTGPDTFFYAMHAHLAEVGAVLGENFDNPHNEYLAILSNNGLPALALYLALLAAVLIRCLRPRQESAMAHAMGWAVLCYAVQGFFSFSICLVAPMFWAMLGIAARESASGLSFLCTLVD